MQPDVPDQCHLFASAWVVWTWKMYEHGEDNTVETFGDLDIVDIRIRSVRAIWNVLKQSD
jgi:hypothetical protein